MKGRLTRRLRRLIEAFSRKSREESRFWYKDKLCELLSYLYSYRKGKVLRRILDSHGYHFVGVPTFEQAVDAVLNIIACDLDRRHRYKLKATLCWASVNRIAPDRLSAFITQHGGLNGCASCYAEHKRT